MLKLESTLFNFFFK